MQARRFQLRARTRPSVTIGARMSTDTARSRTTIVELAAQVRNQLIPLSNTFSYFSIPPMADEDLRQYLHDPIAAISPAICKALGKVGLVLAPYIEKTNGSKNDAIVFEKPAEG